jgi:hypothetical protein
MGSRTRVEAAGTPGVAGVIPNMPAECVLDGERKAKACKGVRAHVECAQITLVGQPWRLSPRGMTRARQTVPG